VAVVHEPIDQRHSITSPPNVSPTLRSRLFDVSLVDACS
jgi:hypothetical protein